MTSKSFFFHGVVLALLSMTLSACHQPGATGNPAENPSCNANPYLMKYHCDITTVQQSAENGNADAQYALGYMYYYGINTTKDRQTADLWIQRAAAQGQPLAQKAWNLIHSGNAGSDFHQAAMQTTAEGQASVIEQQPDENVRALNTTPPAMPLKTHLPAFHSNNNTSQNTKPAELKQWEANQVMDDRDPRLCVSAKPVLADTLSSSVPTKTIAITSTGGYTIQLMGSADPTDLKDFARENHFASNNLGQYKTLRNGAAWYLLTYGHYATPVAAKLALEQLPKEAQRFGPWVKSYTTLAEETQIEKRFA